MGMGPEKTLLSGLNREGNCLTEDLGPSATVGLDHSGVLDINLT